MRTCRRCGATVPSLLSGACERCYEELQAKWRAEHAAEKRAREDKARQEREAEERQRQEEQRRIDAEEARLHAEQQRRRSEALQQRLHLESHLNGLKRMLLEHAARGVSDPETAIKSLSMIMRSADFSRNIEWFWEDVRGNPFLLDAYFDLMMSPLTKGTMPDDAAEELFDGLESLEPGLVETWLSQQPPDSPWQLAAMPQFRRYQQLEAQRLAEQQQQEEEARRRREDEEEARRVQEVIETARLVAEDAEARAREEAEAARLAAEQAVHEAELATKAKLVGAGLALAFVGGAALVAWGTVWDWYSRGRHVGATCIVMAVAWGATLLAFRSGKQRGVEAISGGTWAKIAVVWIASVTVVVAGRWLDEFREWFAAGFVMGLLGLVPVLRAALAFAGLGAFVGLAAMGVAGLFQ